MENDGVSEGARMIAGRLGGARRLGGAGALRKLGGSFHKAHERLASRSQLTSSGVSVASSAPCLAAAVRRMGAG